MKRILVVDDEKDIVDLIAYNLEKEGFEILKSYDGEKALELIGYKDPHLVILDLMLPGIKGLEVCKFIRKSPETASLPIIMLTAKGEEIDKILGLEMGADDYITKPFSVRELIARVHTVLRRFELQKETKAKETFSFKSLHIDYNAYEVTVDNKKVDLSPTEFSLLKFFSQHPGKVYTRDQLLDHVWGDEAFVEPRTVDVHIRRLRAQIERDTEKPQYILTIRGVGYKFTDIK